MAQAPAAGNDVETGDQEFIAAFEQAAADAEKGEVTKAPEKTAEQLAAEQKVIDDAAGPAKTQAELDAEAAAKKKTDDDAAAAQKKLDDDAALAALSPEERTKKEADEKAAADAITKKKADDDAAAALQAKADADAAAKKKLEDDAAALKAKEETPEQKKAREDFEASVKPYEPTAEEQVALDKMKADFPNEYTAMMARLKGVDRDINARVHQAVQAVIGHLNPRISLAEQIAQEVGRQSHLDTLHKAHADYDTVIEKIPAWIKTQSTILQPALQAAYDQGDTKAVLELVTMYKAANPAASGKSAEQLAAEQKVLDDAAAKKKKADDEAAALAPVRGQRTQTQPRGAKDPNDFDGAFNEAAEAAETAGKK